MFNWKVGSTKNAIVGILCLFPLLPIHAAYAQEPYLGEIRMFAGIYCPDKWMEADGRVLDIAQNQALYSLLGNTYGGDGRKVFRLPDLRGRVAIGLGQGPGLSAYRQGMTGGAETVTLSAQEMPAHSHGISTTEELGTSEANVAAGVEGKGGVVTQPVQTAGGSMPHENRPPYLAVRYCVCVDGIYPSRP